ncbi:MAG: hypothetical protein M3276_07820, partial [Actinomycetota bacterium]|nr:hypothetical protein [Actinomycetota bacterium]
MSRDTTRRLPARQRGGQTRARRSRPPTRRPTRPQPPGGDRLRDGWGLGLLVLAALSALALYARAA